MSFSYEVDSDLDLDAEILDAEGDLDSEFGEVFTEEDFAAMGIEPTDPTLAKPGSEGKVLMLAARYAAGLPLWHDKDCYDHGPAEKRSQA